MIDTTKKIDEIVAASDTQFAKLSGTWTTDDPKNLYDQVTSIYNKYQSVKLTSPNPSNPTSTIVPVYISVIPNYKLFILLFIYIELRTT